MSNDKSGNFDYTSRENHLEILATKIIDISISKELKFRKKLKNLIQTSFYKSNLSQISIDDWAPIEIEMLIQIWQKFTNET